MRAAVQLGEIAVTEYLLNNVAFCWLAMLSFHWSISLKATAPAMSVDGDITLFELDDFGDENGVVDWTEISLDYGKR